MSYCRSHGPMSPLNVIAFYLKRPTMSITNCAARALLTRRCLLLPIEFFAYEALLTRFLQLFITYECSQYDSIGFATCLACLSRACLFHVLYLMSHPTHFPWSCQEFSTRWGIGSVLPSETVSLLVFFSHKKSGTIKSSRL